MKKAIIKRRKRVIPAGGASELENGTTEPMGSPSPTPEATMERGTMNEDGSVNLGARRQQQQQQPQQEQRPTLVPENVLRQNRQTSPHASGDLGHYHSSHKNQIHQVPESLTNENRLAPLTSISLHNDRQSSLSPASFLSPSRKRSVSVAEMDNSGPNDHESSKRLSSIKSILNPTVSEPPREGSPDHYLHPMRSPGSTATSAPSPGAYSSTGAVGTPASVMTARSSSRDPTSESERYKAERRAALEREAEAMREMLAAKERELAELGAE